MNERDIRPRDRGTGAEPYIRPRDASSLTDRAATDREVQRRAVGESDRHPLPPPLTAALEDGGRDEVVLVATTVAVETSPDAHSRAALERQRLEDLQRAEAIARARHRPTGFLDAHGASGPGWLLAQGSQSAGFLTTHGADAPGWLASLEARRLAAHRTGWYEPSRLRTR